MLGVERNAVPPGPNSATSAVGAESKRNEHSIHTAQFQFLFFFSRHGGITDRQAQNEGKCLHTPDVCERQCPVDHLILTCTVHVV